tara:strand:- start:78 stop:824 length:747 start_codon:yes stop_codon:yes gene_type:complete
MSILITGASGMLGKSLNKLYIDASVICGRSQLDLSDIDETQKWMKGKHYSTIIHAAAFTDLNYCKNNIDKAIILHASIVDVLSEHCDRLVYISTVPMWKKSEYLPNVYFETKKLGEQVALKKTGNIVVRTNIYGPSSLVDWAYQSLKQKQQINGYENVIFNPVHVDQLSAWICDILKQDAQKQILTISGSRILSKYQFLKEIAEMMHLDSSLVFPITLPQEQDLKLEDPDQVCSFKKGMELIKNDYKN